MGMGVFWVNARGFPGFEFGFLLWWVAGVRVLVVG